MDQSRLKQLLRRAAPAARFLVFAVVPFLRAAGVLAACPANGLTLVPDSLPAATVGGSYEQVFSTTDGSGRTTFVVSSGNLPPGLQLASNGKLSGHTTSPGTFSFAITATDNKDCTGTHAYAVPVVCPTITISPVALPSGTVGTPYSQTLTAAGGTGPYEFSLTSGSLPPGLNLSATGTLSGTPTAFGGFAFTISATDANACVGARSYDLTISPSCPTIDLSPGSLPSGTTATPYSQTITASGGVGPYSFSVGSGSLPPGLTLASSGGLSGSPTATGTFNFVVAATDTNGCTGTRSYSIAVTCSAMSIAPATLPAASTGVAYNQALTGSGGTAPYTFSVSSGSLPSGLTLSSAGSLSGTPTALGTFSFVVLANDANGCAGSQSYSITVSCGTLLVSPAALTGGTVGVAYNQTITASGGTGPYTFAVTSGTLPPGLTLSSGGALTGTPTTAGTFNFTIGVTDANGCSGSRSYSISTACPAITLSPATLPPGTVGAAYSQAINVSGGVAPYSFAITNGTLPTGLTLSTGFLSGTPTTAGNFTFIVTVTDANGCPGSRSYSVTVGTAPCPTITVSPSTLPAGTAGIGYSQTISASGGTGPYAFTVTSGSVPAGLTLSSGGALAGTPTAVGTFNFTVMATDANACGGSRSYSITVACPAITVSPAALPSPTVSVPYSQALTASGGIAPYSFTVTNGSVPTGLTLSPAGALSGTPTTTGDFTFIVTATDGNGCSGSRGYSVSVGTAPCPTVTLSPSTLPAGTAGTPYSQTITASGGNSPYTFSVRSGSLPGGLTLSASGVLSGTPSGAAFSTFFVTARDRNGCSGTEQYTLTISGNSPLLTALNPASASAGGAAFTLQVAGSGFVPGSTIQWNGSPRPTTFVSATALTGSITAADIAAAGSASVTVVNPGGAASNALPFTISSSVCQPPAAPQNPTIVPNDNPTGPVTGVDFLRLTWGPPATGPVPSAYQWSLNGDPFVSAGTATSVVTGPRGSNDPIQLHVRAVGCSPGAAADSLLYAPAPPSAGFSSSGPAAVGTPVAFTDTSDPQATSWLWLFGDGQIATTQSATHAFSSAGTYSVVLIASNGAGSTMALGTQVVQATPSAERPTATRAFVASEPGRQWIRSLRMTGPRRTWLHAAVPGSEDETIVYLRFYDAAGRLVLERRLSVAPGQEAVYDLGAFRLRGAYSVEAVSARPVDLSVVETGPREPAKRRDP